MAARERDQGGCAGKCGDALDQLLAPFICIVQFL
jgi:hypothetical protein